MLLVADAFNEILQIAQADTEVLASYSQAFGGAELAVTQGSDAEYYTGKPALTRRRVGQGTVYYYGAVFNLQTARALLTEMQIVSPFAEVCELPKDVEIAVREDATGRTIFLLNFAGTPQTIRLHQRLRNLLIGEDVEGELTMKPFDVLLLG
jgi:beta-galactosidase